MKKTLIILIRAYQAVLSPALGPSCRFHPSCSEYCACAIQTHGCIKGLWLGLLRICKCHPFHEGGVDFVPQPETVNKGSNL